MTMSTRNDFPRADQAEELLASMFERLQKPTVKLASFHTSRGRQIALARERKNDIFVWAECFDVTADGVEINNQKRPGQPYAAEQTRSSAVNSQCSNLAVGNRAYYLRFETLGSLECFARWYATV